MISFRTYQFGYKSAEAERRHNPALLDEGFFRKDDSVESLLSSPRYLVLGHKGSGKSAIGEHLDLIARSRADLFVDVALLRDFPYDDVPYLVPGTGNEQMRTSLAWSLLLLIRILNSFAQDNSIRQGSEIGALIEGLKDIGLLPKKKFRDLVLASREIDLSVSLPKILQLGIKQAYREPALLMSGIRDRIRDLIATVTTDNQHVIVIDGLDELFTAFSNYYVALAALIHEVDALNGAFAEADACAKIVVLCRTDIFERLPSPNINKLKDYAIVLDWYESPGHPFESNLASLATHRGRLAGYEGGNLLRHYLPREIDRGTRDDGVLSYLLDHTRHSPRDFLQLLHFIQHQTDAVSPSRDAVIAGLRQYSIEYFLPELKDEMAGYFEPDAVEECFRVLGGMRQREFNWADLESHSSRSSTLPTFDLDESLRVLFDCSAIGNIVYRPRPGGRAGTYFTFRYRNRSASINYDERFVFHRGVWKALNLV